MTITNELRVMHCVDENGVYYGLPKSAGRLLNGYRKCKGLTIREVAEGADLDIVYTRAILEDRVHRVDSVIYNRIAQAMGSNIYNIFRLYDPEWAPEDLKPSTYRRLTREELRTPLWKLAHERGRRITHLMIERGMYPSELSRKTGIPTKLINYELNSSTLRAKMDFITKTAEALDVSADLLLGNESRTYQVSAPKVRARAEQLKMPLDDVARKSGISRERLESETTFSVTQREMDYLCDALYVQYHHIKLTPEELETNKTAKRTKTTRKKKRTTVRVQL